ncbi:MAG TPA: arsenic resistance N-acetyltransferase ArsN2 [Chryseolinea sp.]|nr:arsenic resistance N-acetyltransferase ArsN2 [Chryseolinea sp.]
MDDAIMTITTEAEFQSFKALLKSSNLPADDLNVPRDLLVAYVEDGRMVGTGGLEIYGDYGLLRSLSVKLGTRGKALGTTLTGYLIEEARRRRLKSIYLLTETARGFFQRKGFVDISRDQVPVELNASSEFSGVCPKTAVVMKLDLT